MRTRPAACFLDFATLGPGIDAAKLDELVDARYYDYSIPEALLTRLEGCEVAILNKVKLDRSVIAAAPDLRLIVITATGADNVDTAAAAEARWVRPLCVSVTPSA